MLHSKPTSETQAYFKSWCSTYRCLSKIFILAGLILYIGLLPHKAIANQLGMNLNGISYFNPEQPFVNLFKSEGHFSTQQGSSETNEEAYLCTDANGWVTTLQFKLTALSGGTCTATPTFNRLNIVFNLGLPSGTVYPTGNYDVYYNPGGCTYVYGNDATLVSQNVAAGHDVINVATPTGQGIQATLIAMGTGSNYCRNVSVTLSSLTASYLAGCSGGTVGPACFAPKFLSLLAPFSAVRFMDWMCTNNNSNVTAGTWAGRPNLNTPFFGADHFAPNTPCGVPVEYMVALANAGNFDPWFNMPTLGSNDYVTQFATYVYQHLNSNLNAYVEYSNETWNWGFFQTGELINIGVAAGAGVYCQYGNPNCPAGPTGGCQTGGNSYWCNRAVMGHQTVTFCGLWKAAFGSSSSRVNCVLGSQAASTGQASDAFACLGYVSPPCTTGIGFVGIAPYFGCDVGTPSSPNLPVSWLSQSDGGLTSLFAAIETGGGSFTRTGCDFSGIGTSMIAESISWVTNYQTIARTYNVQIIGYESGQAFTSENYDPQFTTLFVDAQTDPRMGTAYTNYYKGWTSQGGGLIMHYNDISGWGKYGSWGALQTLCTPNCSSTSVPSTPKWNALISYISGSPPPPPPAGPTVKINSPKNGATYRGYFNVNITVSAADPNGIASITVKVDSTILKTCNNTTSCSDTWRYRSPPGTHTITAIAMDKAGIQASASIVITDFPFF